MVLSAYTLVIKVVFFVALLIFTVLDSFRSQILRVKRILRSYFLRGITFFHETSHFLVCNDRCIYCVECGLINKDFPMFRHLDAYQLHFSHFDIIVIVTLVTVTPESFQIPILLFSM